MSEFVPTGSNPRMTKAQVKKYIQNMKKAQDLAKEKLKKSEKEGEINKDDNELKDIEKLLELY